MMTVRVAGTILGSVFSNKLGTVSAARLDGVSRAAQRVRACAGQLVSLLQN